MYLVLLIYFKWSIITNINVNDFRAFILWSGRFFSDDIVSVSQEFLKYIGQEMSISVTEDG